MAKPPNKDARSEFRHLGEMPDRGRLEEYWRRNISLVLGLLAIWFIVGYVLAIIFVRPLNSLTFLGAPLGFWIAQNGAIYVFILLILIYCLRMNRLDREFDVEG